MRAHARKFLASIGPSDKFEKILKKSPKIIYEIRPATFLWANYRLYATKFLVIKGIVLAYPSELTVILRHWRMHITVF